MASLRMRSGSVWRHTAFQRAVATGKRVYVLGNLAGQMYRLEDMVALSNGQVPEGEGVTTSVLLVKSTFNLSAPGVVRLGASETGATMRNIDITFTQPNASTPGGDRPPAGRLRR